MTAPAHDPHPGRGAPRQSRALATRESILVAAAEEFATSSYHEASLSRILERSKVTKGALYFHFASKESIALAVVDQMEEQCHEIVARTRAVELDPLRRAAHIAREVQDALTGSLLVAGQRLCSEGFAGPHRPGWPFRYWEEVFGEFFAEAGRVGLLRAGVEPTCLARFVVDLSAGAFVTSLGVSELADLALRVADNWDLVLGGAAADGWLADWHAEGGMRRVLAPHLDGRLPAGGGSPGVETGHL